MRTEIDIRPGEPRRSRGHICFTGTDSFLGSPVPIWEFYATSDGAVYRAPIGNAFDIHLNQRHGRWECTKVHFDLYRGVIIGDNQWFPVDKRPAYLRAYRAAHLADIGLTYDERWHGANPEKSKRVLELCERKCGRLRAMRRRGQSVNDEMEVVR